jgi:hypothetical protein
VYCQEVKGVTRNGVRLREGADHHYDKQSNKLTFSFQGASTIAIGGAGQPSSLRKIEQHFQKSSKEPRALLYDN